MVVAYAAGADGRMRPVDRVGECPRVGDGQECHVVVKGYRPRKTGPCFPIQVLECQTHGGFFTAYPMGHVRYGRERLAPVGVSGAVLEQEVDDSSPGGDRRWHSTLFRRRR